jgi:nucleoside-diphosphate-sugar epimerase
MKSQEHNYQVVVTGASGYLGTKLVNALRASGRNVLGIDLASSDLNLDLSSRNLSVEHKLDSSFILIHLASRLPGTAKGSQLAEESRLIIKNLSQNFKPVKTLFMSSTAVYGVTTAKDFPMVQPWEVYGSAKFEAECLMKKNFPRLTIIRSGTLFDKDRGGSIARIINRGQAGKCVFLPNHGMNHHPFTNTGDVVNFISLWLEGDTFNEQVYDIVTKESLSFREIFSLKGRRVRIRNISGRYLSHVGFDAFPIMGISSWHLNALNYNLHRFEHVPLGMHISTTKELFQSI